MKKWNLEEVRLIKRLEHGIKMELSLQDHIEKQLFWYGYYEKNEMGLLLNFLSEQDIVFDIGANIGYVSLLVSGKCQKGKVISFEPAGLTVDRLKRNLELNQVHNVVILENAVSAESGVSSFFESQLDNLGMSGLTPAENHSGAIFEVKTTTVDQAMIDLNLNRLDLVKIDVEGAEFLVLKGMSQLLRCQRPWILMEVSSFNLTRFGATIDSIFTFMEKVHYSPYKIVSANSLIKMNAPEEGSLIVFRPEEKEFPISVEVANFR